MIEDVIIDQLVTFGCVMGRLTSPTSIEKMSQRLVKFPSACAMFNKMIIYVNIITFVLQTSKKRPLKRQNLTSCILKTLVLFFKFSDLKMINFQTFDYSA